ncbi:MAG: phosphatidylglycerol lysyltransferase domain-containing protein [Nanoarchaeota archaeon]
MPIKKIEGQEAKNFDFQEKWNILGPYLKENGRGCMSYSTLQPGLEYFIDENIGYIAYQTLRNPIRFWKTKKVALADPIAPKEEYAKLLEKFYENQGQFLFLQSTYDFAKILSEFGCKVNRLGIETELDISSSFDISGKKRSKLRQWRNKVNRAGVHIVEQDISDVDPTQIDRVCQDWLQKKGHKEMSFLTRPLVNYKNGQEGQADPSQVYPSEPDVRYFWAWQDDKLIAMSAFDPMYKGDEIFGYYHNIDRRLNENPHGTGASLVIEAARKFSQEGIKVLSLGMSPLHFENEHFDCNGLFSKISKGMYKKCEFIYPFKGNYTHKKKFNGFEKPIYLSSSNGNGLSEVYATLRTIDIF